MLTGRSPRALLQAASNEKVSEGEQITKVEARHQSFEVGGHICNRSGTGRYLFGLGGTRV